MIRAASLALLLSGCAGTATYAVRPFYEPGVGRMVCCEAVAFNGKDVGALAFDVSATADGAVTVHLQETAVGATAPTVAQGAVVSNVAAAVSNAAAAAIKISPK